VWKLVWGMLAWGLPRQPFFQQMNRFAEIADGEWPLTDWVQELWDELVSGCLAEQVGIDQAELGRWTLSKRLSA
jgi:hypothetical protein